MASIAISASAERPNVTFFSPSVAFFLLVLASGIYVSYDLIGKDSVMAGATLFVTLGLIASALDGSRLPPTH